MIPKIIHYCWFGGGPLPPELQRYIETWKKHCPHYEIVEWNEATFDVNGHCFTKSAYEAKKYAYVSDYVRAYALYQFGGIYLDTDVELKSSLDSFLVHDSFTGFEKVGLPFTAVWGSVKGHTLAEKVLDYYTDRIFEIGQETNTVSVSSILVERFGIDAENNSFQVGDDGVNRVHVYPAETLCLDLPLNVATHHFFGSWIDASHVSYKDYLHVDYYTSKALESNDDALLKGIASSLSVTRSCKVLFFSVYYNLIPNPLKRVLRKIIK